ncbi:Endonuclease IV [hydrothermal vent metagenome]|uniref:Endonuclease IV n=1 Tax=hydrothermal vent metagenome TaxID=652676 RepID=A0A3B1DUJ0_9ZZZZ
MPLLGSHLSIAGGYYKAVRAAKELDLECVQIFTKNNNQWRAKEMTDEDISMFRDAIEETGIQMPCAHDSYLINLASPKEELWQKSLAAFIIELERAEMLGLAGVVMHPGSYVKSTEEEGLQKIIEAFDIVLEKTAGQNVEVWIETTAGQGTNLGHRFEHLNEIISGVQENSRLGVCVDTCHIFAAGYPMETTKEYKATMNEFDNVVGIDRIKAFHLNDSKKEFGSRVDRHDHIGQGFVGINPFKHIINDKRFKNIPMYMETPKGDNDEGIPNDTINLNRLRALMKK